MVVFTGQIHFPPVKLNVESGQLQIVWSDDNLNEGLQVPQVVAESQVSQLATPQEEHLFETLNDPSGH